MATQVYSWRVSSELKSKLERQARLRKMSVASVLDTAAREWLDKTASAESDEENQRRLHEEASKSLGVYSFGGGPYTNKKVHEIICKKLRSRAK